MVIIIMMSGTPSNSSSWTQAISNAGWTGRSDHTSVVFDNKMWGIGVDLSGSRYNDV